LVTALLIKTSVYLHCATGGLASLAAEQLSRLGYKDVWAIICQLTDVYSAQEKLTSRQ
jgi:phage shock protein E